MIRRIWLLVLACFLISACEGAPKKVVLGVQSLAEQEIMAKMLRQLIEDHTTLRATIVECGDAYGCTQALYLKRIDLMVGYSGTGLMYSPSRTTRHRGTLKEVRQLYANADITWLDGLGFESGYRLVVLSTKASDLGIVSIADLAKLELGGARIACSRAYLDRPGDGLSSLVRRHGLHLRGEPLVIDDPEKRVMELFRRGADVAIVRRAEVPQDPGLTTLRDTLQFFPRYEAAVVARNEVLAARPELGETIGLLNGRLKTEQMDQLVSEVLINGWAPAGVARRFLHDQDLLVREIDPLERRLAIDIALEEREREAYSEVLVLAFRAVRHAFPNYLVRLLLSDDPVKAVAQGHARLALVGAQRFFHGEGGKPFAIREARVEALAVVGTPYLHILRRAGEGEIENSFAGRIGVSPEGSEGARIAVAILDVAGRHPDAFESEDNLLEQVEQNQLDAALIFRMPGDTWMAKQITERQLILHPLPELVGQLPPFLQPALFPARTYRSQPEAVATIGVQVLLAGPAPYSEATHLGGSPAAALISQSPPVSLEEARAMQEAIATIGPVEPPHPVLPSVWLRSIAEGGLPQGPTTAQAMLDTGLNVFV
ncbi:MAG: glycine betaine ABC transporter substrate-binding protein, partial [Nitrospiraceae bacterium]